MRGRNRRRKGIRVGTPLRWRPCKGAKVQKWKGGLKKGDGCQVTGNGKDKRQWKSAKVQRWKGGLKKVSGARCQVPGAGEWERQEAVEKCKGAKVER
jgi:hypothetical protein